VADGADFRTINPFGAGPRTAHRYDELLTENPATLQYVADQYPQSGLAPAGGRERYRLQQWLNFFTSELHKLVFSPLLNPAAPRGAKEFARDKAEQRPAYLDDRLAGPRLPPRWLHCGGRLSRNRAELDEIRRPRPHRTARRAGLLYQPANAPQRRQSIGRRACALRRRAGMAGCCRRNMTAHSPTAQRTHGSALCAARGRLTRPSGRTRRFMRRTRRGWRATASPGSPAPRSEARRSAPMHH
jgi:hypothetical protein